MQSLSILSHKGGVGKTSVALNIATFLAKNGKNVVLLDCDFHGPSLLTFFEPQVPFLNKLLFSEIDSENNTAYLDNIAPRLNLSGNLYIGFANPNAEAIQHILSIDNKESINMLQRLMKIKRDAKNKLNADYFIIDCSPGTSYSTVNSLLVTDNSLFIVKLSNADILGSSQMISGLYSQLKNKSFILANQVPSDVVSDTETKNEVQTLIESILAKNIGEKVVTFLGWISIDFSFHSIEFKEALSILRGEKGSRIIFTLKFPEHEFSKKIEELIPKIFKSVE